MELYTKDICKTQERLYKYVASHGYDVSSFSALFMNSETANLELDSEYSSFNISFPSEILYLMGKPKLSPSTKENGDSVQVAGWIGYMYRYIQQESGIGSCEIVKHLPYERMEDLWIGGHTLDDQEVVDEMIAEIKNHQKLLEER